ncbi:MAG: bifunctional UDP-N-acetylmuramoyl-tripeptide:D-alanyl-D-alanine ligase/alanine racemase [Chitinophagales bacterium]|nr:bifunctional UDP-N-acetylmuramoyl-tripeptide:D-alanyl-D-alanine ligase/alanine racemase [Chitinophagales bacterium]
MPPVVITDIYNIIKIKEIVKGQFLKMPERDDVIKHLLLDSRMLTEAETSLFFAIEGKRLDGHNYIEELYTKGVRNFIVSKKINIDTYPGAAFVHVKDTVTALQTLAASHRQRFDAPVIGVTGSNGKTIVKEWLFQLLSDDYAIVRSPKSYNSQIGVPLSVWEMHDFHEMGIFEAGISEPGEMDKLENVIKPTIGIFTNIGEAHNEGFLNISHKTKEKLKLFINCEALIYCKDSHEINQSIGEIIQHRIDDDIFKTFTWSYNGDSDVRIRGIHKAANKTYIIPKYKDRLHEIEIPFTDEASIENAIHCICLLIYLGIDFETIAKRMKGLTPVAMRLEMKKAVNNCTLINDAYNSDLGSLKIALDFLKQQATYKQKTLILSDILESGKNEMDLYSEVGEMIANSDINKMIGIGPALVRQKKIFENLNDLEYHNFPDTESCLKELEADTFQFETILIKGARSFRFERISKLLEEKAHETVFEINLNAIRNNLKVYQNLLHPETKCMAMVKAFAYGAGAYEIANILEFNRVDYITVAYTDEGVQLRKAGIKLPIMVMNPEVRSFETIIKYELEPEIYSFRILRKFVKVLREMGVRGSFPIHLKLDTGMNRLGFLEEELESLSNKLKKMKGIEVKSIFSHLAAAESEHHDEFTWSQIERFDRMSKFLMSALDYPVLRHILNSSGIVRFTKAQFDMVRIGLGLYGIDPSGTLNDKLETVGRLRSVVSQIRKISTGDTIGYGRSGVAERDMQIGIIAIGYADGLDRRFSNGVGHVIVNGAEAKIVGSVCMDMAMIDLTDIEAEEGDEVLVFGEENTVASMAEKIGCIPYELLTGISARVKRVYYSE